MKMNLAQPNFWKDLASTWLSLGNIVIMHPHWIIRGSFLLATPIFVSRNLVTLHDVLWPSRCVNITQKSLILGTIWSKFSVSKFGDPFLEIGDPRKGRDPRFENRCIKFSYSYKLCYFIMSRFPETSQLQPPILGLYNASFNYPDQPPLFKKVDFGIDMESRVAIVGTFSNLG